MIGKTLYQLFSEAMAPGRLVIKNIVPDLDYSIECDGLTQFEELLQFSRNNFETWENIYITFYPRYKTHVVKNTSLNTYLSGQSSSSREEKWLNCSGITRISYGDKFEYGYQIMKFNKKEDVDVWMDWLKDLKSSYYAQTDTLEHGLYIKFFTEQCEKFEWFKFMIVLQTSELIKFTQQLKKWNPIIQEFFRYDYLPKKLYVGNGTIRLHPTNDMKSIKFENINKKIENWFKINSIIGEKSKHISLIEELKTKATLIGACSNQLNIDSEQFSNIVAQLKTLLDKFKTMVIEMEDMENISPISPISPASPISPISATSSADFDFSGLIKDVAKSMGDEVSDSGSDDYIKVEQKYNLNSEIAIALM